MGIERNAGGGSFIKHPGEYRVRVTLLTEGLSKKGQPMLTVTFQTENEETIKGYFVKTLGFHMKNLKELKKACGVSETTPAAELLNRECGILVEADEPDPETSRVFLSISGYGPASAVSESGFAQGDVGGMVGQVAKSMEVPF